MKPGSYEEICGTCLDDHPALWWQSRQGYLVCRTCCPDPVMALMDLARYLGNQEKREQAIRAGLAIVEAYLALEQS